MRSLLSTVISRGSAYEQAVDSYSYLQGLLDAGGSVTIPAGTYYVSQTLQIDQSNVTLNAFGVKIRALRSFLFGGYQYNNGTTDPILYIGHNEPGQLSGFSNADLEAQAPLGRLVDAALTEDDTTIEVADSGDAIPTAPFDAVVYERNQSSNGEYNIREIVRVTAVDGTTLTIERGIGRDFSSSAGIRWRTDGADFLDNVKVRGLEINSHVEGVKWYADFGDVQANLVKNLTFEAIKTHRNHDAAGRIDSCDSVTVKGWDIIGEPFDTSGAGGSAYGLVFHGGRGHVIRAVRTVGARRKRNTVFIGGSHKWIIDGSGSTLQNAYSQRHNGIDLHGKGEYDGIIRNSVGGHLIMGSHFRGVVKVTVQDSEFNREILCAPGCDQLTFIRVKGKRFQADRRTVGSYNPTTGTIGSIVHIQCEFETRDWWPALWLHEVESFSAVNSKYILGVVDWGADFGLTVGTNPKQFAVIINGSVADANPDSGGDQPGLPSRYGVIDEPTWYGDAETMSYSFDGACVIDNSRGDGTYEPMLFGSDNEAQDVGTLSIAGTLFKGKTARAILVGSAATAAVVNHTKARYVRTGGTAEGIVNDTSGNADDNPVETPVLE